MDEDKNTISTESLLTFKAMEFSYNATRVVLTILLLLELFVSKSILNIALFVLLFQPTALELSKGYLKINLLKIINNVDDLSYYYY